MKIKVKCFFTFTNKKIIFSFLILMFHSLSSNFVSSFQKLVNSNDVIWQPYLTQCLKSAKKVYIPYLNIHAQNKHTARKSQIMFKKFNYQKKSQNCEFEFLCQNWIIFLWLCWVWYIDFDLNLNFNAENGQNSTFSIIYDFVHTLNHDFWRENSNYPTKFSI